MTPSPPALTIAVILPCHDEAPSIARTIAEFREALPTAVIWVIDNASTDDTARIARAAGARVIHEATKGKGNAVRRAFAEVEADIYLMADGDGTYEAARAPEMVEQLTRERLDMIVGVRCEVEETAFRRGHRFGNRLFNGLVALLFGRRFTDIFSGYRVLSRAFVKSFPAISQGFEIETELTVHALQLRLPVAEVPALYRSREAGSASKLQTYRDGLKILWTIFSLTRQNLPLLFYATIAAALAMTSLALGLPVVAEYLQTGLVLRLPLAVLATGVMILACLSLTVGLVLYSIYYYQVETKRLLFLMAKSAAAAPGGGCAVRTRPGDAAQNGAGTSRKGRARGRPPGRIVRSAARRSPGPVSRS